MYSFAFEVASIVTFALGTHAFAGGDKPCHVQYERMQVMVNGTPVELDVFHPTDYGKFPLVYMLHGSAGLFSVKSGDMPKRDNFGEHKFACEGRVAILVHYLDVSGVKSVSSAEFMRANANTWLAAADAGLTDALKLPYVDARHVALLGESLGGYLAVVLGLQRPEVTSVEAYSSGNPEAISRIRVNKPPMFLYHGDKDELVAASEAEDTCRWLISMSVPCTLKHFPQASHVLDEAALESVQSHVLSQSGK